MFRAFQRKLATHATLSAAVVCLVVLGAAALIWWSAAGLPDAVFPADPRQLARAAGAREADLAAD